VPRFVRYQAIVVGQKFDSKSDARTTNVPVFLCVDDEPSVLLTEKGLLESVGFRVLTAESGPEAIRIFKVERIDVVVMDYFMQPMNGLTTARKMKELKPEVIIVFLSAYSELPGETIGLANCWVKKGEEEPEHFLARLSALAGKPPSATNLPERCRREELEQFDCSC
jgi:CheY-like chemotaxis protein